MIKLIANAICGVTVTKDFDDSVKIYENENDFFDDLHNLPFNKVIGCEVSQSMEDEIRELYGIYYGIH